MNSQADISKVSFSWSTSRLGLAVRLLLLIAGVFHSGLQHALAEGRQPVVTASFAGINRLLDDLDYIGRLSDRRGLAEIPRSLLIAAGGLEGINRDQPAGLLQFISDPPSKKPDAVLAIPVNDRAGFRQLLKQFAKVTEISDVDESRQTLQAGDKTLHLRWAGDFALISEVRELVDSDAALAMPVRLEEYSRANDFTITVHRSGIPGKILEKVIRELPERIRKDAEQPENESDDEKAIRKEFLDLAIKAGLLVTEGVREVSFRVNISPEQEGVLFSGRVGAVPASELSQVLENLPGEGQAYGHVAEQSALMLQWNISLPGRVREFLTSAARLGARNWQEKVGAGLKEEDREPLRNAMQAFVQTLQEGQIRGLLGMTVDRNSHVAILVSEQLADPQAFDRALRTLIPYAQKGGDLREVDLEVSTVKGAAVHRLRGKPGRERDQRLFGGDPSLYLTFSESASWLAVGSPLALESLKPAADGVSSSSADRSLLKGELHVHPWISLIEADSDDERLIEALREAFPHVVPDRITAELSSTQEGLELKVQADESFLHFLGLGISAAIAKQ